MTAREANASGGMAASEAEPRVMTREEAVAAYPDEWIFMQITEDGDDGWLRAGIVLAHHPKRWGISDTEIAVMSDPRKGVIGYATFFGVPLFKTNEAWVAYQAEQQAARHSGA